MIGAYILFHDKTGWFYIGSSQDIKHRYTLHRSQMRCGTHPSAKMKELWKISPHFTIECFFTETREDAFVLEQAMILENLDNPMLVNIGLGVRGGDNFTRHPERDKIIEKRVETQRRIIREMSGEDRKARWSMPGEKNPMYGKTHSVEARSKISKANKGNKTFLGKKHTTEARRLLSEHAKRRTGNKNHFYGKHHSDATKQKIREIHLGRVPTNVRPVSIDGVVYPSLTEAGRKLGKNTTVILHRVKSKNPKFSEYRWTSEMPND